MHISRFCPSAVILKQFFTTYLTRSVQETRGTKNWGGFLFFFPRKKNFMGAGLLGRQKCPWLLGNKLRQRNETHCFFPGFLSPPPAGSVRGAETVSGEKRGQHSHTNISQTLPVLLWPRKKGQNFERKPYARFPLADAKNSFPRVHCT